MKKGTGKIITSLILSVCTIFLCFGLMIYTTYSLLSSSDGSKVIVTSGNMEMDLLQADNTGNYTSIAGMEDVLFGDELWEPNQTRVVFLQVKNNGNIPVQYRLQLNAEVEEFKDGLQFVAFESEFFNVKGLSWEKLIENQTAKTLQHGLNVLTKGDAGGNGYVYMEPGETHSFLLAVHMPKECTNVYQGKICTVDVSVFAVQGNAGW